MARRDDVAGALRRIDRRGDRVGAVMRGNAGGDAFARFDGDGEIRRVARLVGARHQFEMQFRGALLRQRKADQAAPIAGHEVDRLGRRHLRRNDEVALILAVLGVDQDEHPARPRIVENLLNVGKLAEMPRVFPQMSSAGAPVLVQPRNITRHEVNLQIEPRLRVFAPMW